MLHELIKTLNEADAGLDHRQIAEALWLAQFDVRIETLSVASPVMSGEAEHDEQEKPDDKRKDPTAAQQQTQKPPIRLCLCLRTNAVSIDL